MDACASRPTAGPVDLRPGGLVHLETPLPRAVEAVEPSRLLLAMLGSRVQG